MNDNELIAGFMKIPSYKFGGKAMYVYADNNHRTEVDLHYHTSWDWLMPVVDKIVNQTQLFELIPQTIKINRQESLFNIFQALSTIDIKHVYTAVVEFIKWYNKKIKSLKN